MVKRVDNDMRRLNDIKLWFPYIGNNIRIRYIQPGVAILQTPSGVKSFSLGCSIAEPQERIKPNIKPLAGDTNPREHETKPTESPLRGLNLFLNRTWGYAALYPRLKCYTPAGFPVGNEINSLNSLTMQLIRLKPVSTTKGGQL